MDENMQGWAYEQELEHRRWVEETQIRFTWYQSYEHNELLDNLVTFGYTSWKKRLNLLDEINTTLQ